MQIETVTTETQEIGGGGTMTDVHFCTDKGDITIMVFSSGETQVRHRFPFAWEEEFTEDELDYLRIRARRAA